VKSEVASVAQSCTLLFRRIAFCEPSAALRLQNVLRSADCKSAKQQSATLRYLLVLAVTLIAPNLHALPSRTPIPFADPPRPPQPTQPYGLPVRPPTKSYLFMPTNAEGRLPRLLSQTGAFDNTRALRPAGNLIPYDLNLGFWSDSAVKTRWISLPTKGTIRFASTGEWTFPSGTVFVKHFELATDETNPDIKQRLETRLLVRDHSGGVYGATYKWRADNSDADLLATNLTEAIAIRTATGMRTQLWYYPSRADCLTCHTPIAGGVLGLNTRQLNRDFLYPTRVTDNQLRAWNSLRLFEPLFAESAVAGFPKLASPDDTARTLEDRARSYLDVNCGQCHRPGGTVAFFDARYDVPLENQALIGGRVLIDEGIDGARAIAPNDIWRSIVFLRTARLDGTRMPPLAHNELDQKGLALLRQWIESLPGPPVLPPPTISPRGSEIKEPITVTLQGEPGAVIRFTLDGSAPAESDPVYEKPISIAGPTVVRARAFKPGFTKSIPAQEVFAVGN